jgi:hypothetical protein
MKEFVATAENLLKIRSICPLSSKYNFSIKIYVGKFVVCKGVGIVYDEVMSLCGLVVRVSGC